MKFRKELWLLVLTLALVAGVFAPPVAAAGQRWIVRVDEPFEIAPVKLDLCVYLLEAMEVDTEGEDDDESGSIDGPAEGRDAVPDVRHVAENQNLFHQVAE